MFLMGNMLFLGVNSLYKILNTSSKTQISRSNTSYENTHHFSKWWYHKKGKALLSIFLTNALKSLLYPKKFVLFNSKSFQKLTYELDLSISIYKLHIQLDLCMTLFIWNLLHSILKTDTFKYLMIKKCKCQWAYHRYFSNKSWLYFKENESIWTLGYFPL